MPEYFLLKSLNDGEMRKIKVEEGKEILLCRVDGVYSAVGAYCPHYGAPLDEGVLSGDIVMCPWHHSCFNVKTGSLVDPPALNSLTPFEIKIKSDGIYIILPEVFEGNRIPDMIKQNTNKDDRIFVIAGAGAAGNAAAQALRENGFQGIIKMITREKMVPYDRPNLSKAYLSGEAPKEWMPLRTEDFYNEYGIDILYNHHIENIDLKAKKISFQNKETVVFNKLLLATGGIPVKLEVPGAHLNNVFYLRSFNDCEEIINAASKKSEAVIVGDSFIGMETASALVERGVKVTVISRHQLPFETIFGNEAAGMILNQHKKHGVQFEVNSEISNFLGDGKVSKVVLKNGKEIKADFIIAGIGIRPSLEFLGNIKLSEDGGIPVDNHMQYSDDVYAAGDIASFIDPMSGKRIRIEHWRTAEQLGRIAGANMAGKEIEYSGIPFFWTDQAGLMIRYIGHAKEWDELIIDGNIAEAEFIQYFINNNQVIAAAANKKDKDLAAIHAMMRNKKNISVEAIRDGSFNLMSNV